MDAVGNFYIVDTGNSRIRKVAPNGIISTIAGTNDAIHYGGWFSGDGGPAVLANLHHPASMVLDPKGGFYIADASNTRIRRVDKNGIITTVAGSGAVGFDGDGGPATSASLSSPSGVALDGQGNLYFSDTLNSRVRKVDTNGIITTIAGNGGSLPINDPVAFELASGNGGPATGAPINGPVGVTFDGAGNLYIADQGHGRIRRVDPSGIITTFAGGGTTFGEGVPATKVSLNTPSFAAFDKLGNLFIADSLNFCLREVNLVGLPYLPLTGIGTNNNGNYDVVISNQYGSVTSSVAGLTVVLPPSIAQQPATQSTVPGTNVTLFTVVSGTPPLFYDWYFNATNLVQSGSQSSLTLSNLNHSAEGAYTVIITNAYASATSQVAMVAFPPSLSLQPSNLTVLPGTSGSFKVAAQGLGPITYQWQLQGTSLPNNLISTVAGSGAVGYAGDGGQALGAALYYPRKTLFDTAGRMYIADNGNNRIRRVDTNGTIITIAGGGNAGDGPATNASLLAPYDIALDGRGNLFLAEYSGSHIRRMDTNGMLLTVAGGGTGGLGGQATNAVLNTPTGLLFDTDGSLLIADEMYSGVLRMDTNGILTRIAGNGTGSYSGDGGPATNAAFNSPCAMTFDLAGNLLIIDTYNHCLREVLTNGTILSLVGNGSPGFTGDGGPGGNATLNRPNGVTSDADGNIYIADTMNHRIRKLDPNGTLTTVAGKDSSGFAGDGGPATNATFFMPMGLSFDPAGNLYLADYGNQRIRRITLAAAHSRLTFASVAITNVGDYRVIITNPYGSITSAVATLTVAAPPEITSQPVGGKVPAGTFVRLSVSVVGSGPFYYSWYVGGTTLLQSGTNNTLTLPHASTNDSGDYVVVVSNPFGSVPSHVASLGVYEAPSVTQQPASQTVPAGSNATLTVTVSGPGPRQYIWQRNGTRLPPTLISIAGTGFSGFTGDGGPALNAKLNGPYAATFDNDGNPVICDTANNRVRRVGKDGIITTIAGNGASSTIAAGKQATNSPLPQPSFAIFDAAGNLYIASLGTAQVVQVDTSGVIRIIAGNRGHGFGGDGLNGTNASLNSPTGLAFDAVGNLFIADSANNRIRKVDQNGIITTVAGKSGNGYSGDGGPATNALLSIPWGISVDATGNLYIANNGDHRVRKVGLDGIITTIAGKGTSGYAGDGGLAINAILNQPENVAFDFAGNIFISDELNSRIRMINRDGIISTISAPDYEDFSSIAIDSTGNILITDYFNWIREFVAPGPVLSLTNLTPATAGDYTVVISNPYGSVTSAVATISVALPNTAPPIILRDSNFGFRSNQFGFNVSGNSAQAIVVEGSSNLTTWLPLVTNVFGPSPFYFFDSLATNMPLRFYRARLQ